MTQWGATLVNNIREMRHLLSVRTHTEVVYKTLPYRNTRRVSICRLYLLRRPSLGKGLAIYYAIALLYTLTRFSLTEAELRLRHGGRAEAEAERVGPAHQVVKGAAAEAPAWRERDAVRSMRRVTRRAEHARPAARATPHGLGYTCWLYLRCLHEATP